MDMQTFEELGFELWTDRGSVDRETEFRPRSRVFTVLSPTNQPMGYALALETGEIVDSAYRPMPHEVFFNSHQQRVLEEVCRLGALKVETRPPGTDGVPVNAVRLGADDYPLEMLNKALDELLSQGLLTWLPTEGFQPTPEGKSVAQKLRREH